MYFIKKRKAPLSSIHEAPNAQETQALTTQTPTSPKTQNLQYNKSQNHPRH